MNEFLAWLPLTMCIFGLGFAYGLPWRIHVATAPAEISLNCAPEKPFRHALYSAPPIDRLAMLAWSLAVIIGLCVPQDQPLLAASSLLPLAILGGSLLAFRVTLTGCFQTRLIGGTARGVTLALLLVVAGVISLSLALHLWPGFERHIVMEATTLGKAANPMTIAYSLDKLLAAVLLFLLVSPKIQCAQSIPPLVKPFFTLFVPLVAAFFLCANLLGVALDPKWEMAFVGFILINLISTCLAEEIFFRLFIQETLERIRVPGLVAAGVSAGLFTLAHYSSQVSAQYLVLVGLAGCLYAWSYSKTRAIEVPVLLHLLVNSVHLILFEYPFR
ncbi:hypothetical protein TDB9533_02407 [Thalassocella blandensis]|nr:hypothetical protein TDB9533_02407 [Thalassocella blandensis]